MPRAARIWYPGAVYHIIHRGNNQQAIFFEDADRQWFLRTVLEVKKEIGFTVHAYCLMDNHYHMIVETQDRPISEIMHAISSRYATRINTKYDRKGHLFQGRFKGILVDKDNYLLELSRYIHLNPVKAGIVARPEDFMWSSYKFYSGAERDLLVETGFILDIFRKTGGRPEDGYVQFVREGMEHLQAEGDWLDQNLRRQRFLGSRDFVKMALKRTQS